MIDIKIFTKTGGSGGVQWEAGEMFFLQSNYIIPSM